MQDRNPRRHYLMVISMVFIVYYWSGGYIPGDKIQLPVANIQFENPAVLALIAWGLLFWFAYRYRIFYTEQFTHDFSAEIQQWGKKRYIQNFVEKAVGEPFPHDDQEGYHLSHLRWGKRGLVGRYEYSTNIYRDSYTGNAITRGTVALPDGKTSTGDIPFSDSWEGRLITLRACIECFYQKPAISSYLAPYILFWIAVVSGIYSIIS